MNFYFLIAFISYFAFFLILSIYFYRKNKDASSFILADRSMNYFVTAISAQASDMSDWLFMGYPGLIYGLGFFNVWVAIGLVVFMFLNWQFIAPKLRLSTEKYNSITLSSFFENRFKDNSGILRLLTVFFTVYFLSFYIGAELIGLGRLFQTTFSINYNVGIIISLFLVLINILIGGFTALAWSDMFRGLFLLGMIIIVPITAYYNLPLNTSLPSISVNSIVHGLIPTFTLSTLSSILLLATGWGLGYFGSPHILINFMGIKDVKKISNAKYVGISWQILVLAAATVVGLIGVYFFTNTLPNRELVFIEMVKSLFHPLFAGFILCAILAATMSVMTAQILATASIVSEDLFKRIIKKNLNNNESLWLIRICIIALPLLACIISYNSTATVNDLVSYAWSGLGLAFSPIVIAALYGKSLVNKYGAIASMALGGIIGIIWPYTPFKFMPLLPGFTICLATIAVVSVLTQKQHSIVTEGNNIS